MYVSANIPHASSTILKGAGSNKSPGHKQALIAQYALLLTSHADRLFFLKFEPYPT